jgi:hypothetical protein
MEGRVSSSAQTRLESDRGTERSEAADVERRQVVRCRLDHVTVVMHLHNLGPPGRRASGRREWWRFEGRDRCLSLVQTFLVQTFADGGQAPVPVEHEPVPWREKSHTPRAVWPGACSFPVVLSSCGALPREALVTSTSLVAAAGGLGGAAGLAGDLTPHHLRHATGNRGGDLLRHEAADLDRLRGVHGLGDARRHLLHALDRYFLASNNTCARGSGSWNSVASTRAFRGPVPRSETSATAGEWGAGRSCGGPRRPSSIATDSGSGSSSISTSAMDAVPTAARRSASSVDRAPCGRISVSTRRCRAECGVA